MPFKTFVAGTEGLASDINTYLMNQTVMTFTNAAARDAALTAPTEGMFAYLTQSDHYTIYSGSAWVITDVAWNAWTPTFTNLTLGTGGTTACYYARIGKTIVAQGYVTLGTTPTVSGQISVSLPVDVVAQSRNTFNGVNVMRDSVAVRSYYGTNSLVGSAPSVLRLNVINTAATYAYSGSQTATVPHTWTSNDYFMFQVFYQGV